MTRTQIRTLIVTAMVTALLPVAAADAQNRWRESKAINIAHQGGEDEFPSNTMYAFHEAMEAGADMLELDVGVTKDDKVIVMHDTTVDGKTNGRGNVSSLTLRQIKRLDAAYWFAPRAATTTATICRAAPTASAVSRRAGRSRPRATGEGLPVPTLTEVMRAFPRTPINIEIKGRTPDEETSEYVRNAEVLAALLETRSAGT